MCIAELLFLNRQNMQTSDNVVPLGSGSSHGLSVTVHSKSLSALLNALGKLSKDLLGVFPAYASVRDADTVL